MIPGFNSGPESLILLVLLVGAFVVAFKIMEMVFETVLVSVLSGIFYLLMVYLFSFKFSIENVLLFAFLGATLYMGYSLLASAYAITSPILRLPLTIAKNIFRSITGVFSRSSNTGSASKEGPDTQEKLKRYWRKLRIYASKLEDRLTSDEEIAQSYSTPEPSASSESTNDSDDGRDVKEVVLRKVNEEEDEKDNE